MTRRTASVSLFLGGLGAAVLAVGARVLSAEQALEGWAVLLAVAGTIYIGAALADGRRRPIVVETGVGALATAGILLSPAVGAVLMSLSPVIVAANARYLTLD